MQDWIAELKRIAELRDMGILTEEEFLAEKSQIMGSRTQEVNAQAPVTEAIRANSTEQHSLDDSVSVFGRSSTSYNYSGEIDTDPVPEYSFLAKASSKSDTTSSAMTSLPVGAGLSQILDGTSGGQQEQIGSYRIISELGVGGMGVVYRARHVEEAWALEQGGDVALKIMRPKFARDPQFRSRFMREASLGKQINHPNVARVHEVVVVDEQLVLVMEYVAGFSLDALLPAQKNIADQSTLLSGGSISTYVAESIEGAEYSEIQAWPLERLVSFLTPLCSALDSVHALGVVHRDLKPENIRVCAASLALGEEEPYDNKLEFIQRSDLKPVVLDFGIAKSESSQEMTRTGMLMGTVAYMAPEQVDAKSVGPAADRYALGLIVYELLSGQRPWDRDTSEGRIYTIKLQGGLIPLHYVTDTVTERVSQVVMKMLSKRPQDRYNSCDEFLSDLCNRPRVQRSENRWHSESEAISRVNLSDAFQGSPQLITKAEIESARAQYNSILDKIEETETLNIAHGRKLVSLQRTRDEQLLTIDRKINELNVNISVQKESLERESHEILESRRQDFIRLRLQEQHSLEDLDKAVVVAKNRLSRFRNQGPGGLRIFGLFGSGNKAEYQQKLSELETALSEVQSRFKQRQIDYPTVVQGINDEEAIVLHRTELELETRLDLALSRLEQQVIQTRSNINAVRSRSQRAYELSKQDVEKQRRECQKDIFSLQQELQRLREGYPPSTFVIKTEFEVQGVSFDLVQLPAGKFVMGAIRGDVDAQTDESPKHTVLLTKALWVACTTTTQSLYEAVMGENPSRTPGRVRPVECITWFQAVRFCNKLSELCGLDQSYEITISGDESHRASTASLPSVRCHFDRNGFRLMTEAEWEYASRSGGDDLYSGGRSLRENGWYRDNRTDPRRLRLADGVDGALPVSQLNANAFGLFDMSGNVWEWCWDLYGPYPTLDQTNPSGPNDNKEQSIPNSIRTAMTQPGTNPNGNNHRVRRGGSFRNKAQHCRTTNRAHSEANSVSSATGFRFCRSDQGRNK